MDDSFYYLLYRDNVKYLFPIDSVGLEPPTFALPRRRSTDLSISQ